MRIDQKVKNILEILKINCNNPAVLGDLSYSAFLVSLLPIPVIQQSAQIIDRIASNKELSIRFNEVWNEIKSINSRLEATSDEIEKLHKIAGTVQFNEKLNNKLSSLINDTTTLLKQENSEWTVLTENWSYQEILNSLVYVDYAKIISTSGSTNVIKNTEINAKKTLLHSSNKSQNFVSNSLFKGTTGSVGMNGISTQGNIMVEGSSIGFGKGSAIIFGNPNLVKGECPSCNQVIQVDRNQLVGYSSIKCHNCHAVSPYNLS